METLRQAQRDSSIKIVPRIEINTHTPKVNFENDCQSELVEDL